MTTESAIPRLPRVVAVLGSASHGRGGLSGSARPSMDHQPTTVSATGVDSRTPPSRQDHHYATRRGRCYEQAAVRLKEEGEAATMSQAPTGAPITADDAAAETVEKTKRNRQQNLGGGVCGAPG